MFMGAALVGASANNKYALALGGAIYAGSMGAALSKYFFSERLSNYIFNKSKSKEGK